MKKVDSRSLFEHMEKANQKVSAWPQWQQQIFHDKISNTNSKKSMPTTKKTVHN